MAAHQAPLSTEFSRQEYWSELPFPSPNGMLFTHKKVWNWIIYAEVDGLRDYHTELKKSEREKQIYIHAFMESRKKEYTWATTFHVCRLSWTNIHFSWSFKICYCLIHQTVFLFPWGPLGAPNLWFQSGSGVPVSSEAPGPHVFPFPDLILSLLEHIFL